MGIFNATNQKLSLILKIVIILVSSSTYKTHENSQSLYTIISAFHCLTFLMLQISFFYHLLSVLKNSFGQSVFKDISVSDKFFKFSSIEKVLISPSFTEDSFTGYGILGWQFSFSTFKMCHFFLTFMVSDDNSCHLNWCSPKGKCYYFKHFFP